MTKQRVIAILNGLLRALEAARDTLVVVRDLVDRLPDELVIGGSGGGSVACVVTDGFGVHALQGRPSAVVALAVAIALPAVATVWQWPRQLLTDETEREQRRLQARNNAPQDLREQLAEKGVLRREISKTLGDRIDPPLERRPVVKEEFGRLAEALIRNCHDPAFLLLGHKGGTREYRVEAHWGRLEEELKVAVWDLEAVHDAEGRAFEQVLAPSGYDFLPVHTYVGREDEYYLLALSNSMIDGHEALRISDALTNMLVRVLIEERGDDDLSQEASDA